MDGNSVLYVFDTSCFIEGWHRFYSPSIMPDYWELLSADIKQGKIIFPMQVIEEINKQDDDLNEWLDNKKENTMLSSHEQNEIEKNVKQIMKKYPNTISRLEVINADPYVIGLATASSLIPTERVVVTMERENPNRSAKKYKIPDVCREEGIKCISPMQHIEARGWRFGIK